MSARAKTYRGRLAPSPTGLLHAGHARTFWIAHERARRASGHVVLRSDDLDRSRVRPDFIAAMFEDLRWLGLSWDEGPDVGGPFAPYAQSGRIPLYRRAFDRLRDRGLVYPCTCSRQDVLRSIQAPNLGDEEPVYPGTCRHRSSEASGLPIRVNWRFRVSAERTVCFVDSGCGPQKFLAGRDFGDFVVWRADDLPSYQLACVVDDAEMRITEVVRGSDLLVSTARQILLYEALEWIAPSFHHTALMRDDRGVRLAKRHDALSIRELRKRGKTAIEVINSEAIATFSAPTLAERAEQGKFPP